MKTLVILLSTAVLIMALLTGCATKGVAQEKESGYQQIPQKEAAAMMEKDDGYFMLHTSHGKLKKRELEEQMAYNGDYLNRIYKKQKGISISEAGREIMIKDAKHLLTKSNMSIDEVMQELGISSRGYFFSLFYEKTGLTPKEYRSKYKA